MIIERTIAIAVQEIGVTEVPRGSNGGPRVSEYQRRTGYGGRVPWCLCFLYWCIDEAATRAGVNNPLPRTGSCDGLLSWADRNKVLHLTPRPGDIGLVMASKVDATHCFLVERVDGDFVQTIEGNTNDGGSREGVAVMRRRRAKSSRVFYVRWESEVLPPEPGYDLIGPKGKPLQRLRVLHGSAMAPIRETAVAFGFRDGRYISPKDIGWDAANQVATLKGAPLNCQTLVRDGTSFVPIRKLASALGYTVEVRPGQQIYLI